MNAKLTILTLIFLLISLITVFAGNIEVNLLEENSKISVNEVATFELEIINKIGHDSDFFISFPYHKDWRVVAEPYLINIPHGGSEKTKLTVYPLSGVAIGNYDLMLNIKTRDKKTEINYPLKVNIIPIKKGAVETTIIMDDKIDPRFGANIKISLFNLYNYELSAIKLLLQSKAFSEERFIDLKPREKKFEEFKITFDEKIIPGNYNIDVKIKKDRDILGSASKLVTIAKYADITEKVAKETNFLKERLIVNKENIGTETIKETVKIRLSFLQTHLSKYNIEPDEIIEDIAVWTFILQPGEKKQIIVDINYTTPLLIALFILIIVFLIAHFTKQRVIILKRIIDVKKDKEGINSMKVILHIKNKSSKKASEVKVFDFLPKLIAASPKEFGTIKPMQVQRSSLGRTRLIWDLNKLEKGEERIISYVAKCRLSIIGKLILNNAVVEYKFGKKKSKSRSNKLILFTSPTQKERKAS